MTPTGEPRLLHGPAGRALALLAGIQLLAYVDRFVVAALVESLRADLWLTDTRLGVLMTAFALVHLAASPSAARLGGRLRRPRLLALAVALWSGATLLSGAARGFWTLLAARAAAGAGEAASGAVAPALLAARVGPPQRPRAWALFLAAIPVGTALAYAAGGIVDRTLGWRAAFALAGAPGLALALLCLRLADPQPAAGPSPRAGAEGLRAAARRLRARPAHARALLGHAAYAFAVAGLAFWMPAFLQRSRGVPRAVAGVQLGAVVLMTAFAGTFAGGHAAEALRRRVRDPELWVCGGAALAAAPLALVVFTAYRPAVYLVALVAAQLLVFAAAGPATAAVASALPPAERAGAAALSLVAVRLLGEVPAPALVGLLSDRTSLGRAVLAVPAALLVAGVAWTWTAWRGERAARAAAGGAIPPG